MLPAMKRRTRGAIVNIATDLVARPTIPYHDYTTAKAALIGFSRTLAVELGPLGIRVNCVAPGLVYPTDSTRDTKEDVKETIIADASAGAAIFIIILVILSLAAAFISRRVQSSDIGTLDRSLGFLFGLLRGAFIICLAYLMLIQFIPPKEHPKWIKETKTLPALKYGSTMLVQISPKFISGGLETAETWDEKLMKTLKDAGNMVGGIKDDISKSASGYKKEDRKLLDRLFGGSDDKDKDKDGSKN